MGRQKKATTMAMATFETREWAWLPEHVLDRVLDKLTQLLYYVRFAAVCKPWRSVALHQKKRWIQSSCRHQLPLLMVPTKDHSNSGSTKRCLYNVVEGKLLNHFKFHVPFNERCCGSSHGWVIFTNVDNMSVILFNPFTGDSFALPPLVEMLPDETENPSNFLYKVILSNDPDACNDEFQIVAIYGQTMTLAIMNSGDKKWNLIKTSKGYTDLIYYKGTIHVVNYFLGVFTLEISGKMKQVLPFKEFVPGWKYLMESSRGDLLLIVRVLTEKDHESQMVTSGFRVFKLLEDPSQPMIEVNTLEGDAIFLGANESMSVRAADFLGCQPNSIYYTDDYVGAMPHGPRDIGVFNMENGKISEHYSYTFNIADHKDIKPSPTWVLPRLRLF